MFALVMQTHEETARANARLPPDVENLEIGGLITWLGVDDTGSFFHSCYALFSGHDSTDLH